MASVLIVDDDPLFSDMLCRRVARAGHEVSCAHRLADGIRQVEAGGVDVVLLDVNLPDGNGLDAIARMKAAASHPEVIIITGDGDAEGAELAIRGGAWDYVKKRHSFEELVLHLTSASQFCREKAAATTARTLDLCGIIGGSPAMKTCYDLLGRAACCDASALIVGETGTGKELFARAIHANSERCGRDFVVVDCATLTESLVKSTLFGHARGSFTGAFKDQVGLIEKAHGGTLFLDEIGEMPLSVQKAFLRVLQEHRFRPVGGQQELESDFRLIAATNRDLDDLVAQDLFREDLLFRVRAFVIELPPLRRRDGDIARIAESMIARSCRRNGVDAKGVSPEFLAALEAHDWPGNVRELEHALDRAVAAAMDVATLYPAHLPRAIRIRQAKTALLQAEEPPLAAPAQGVGAVPYPTPRQAQDAAMEVYLRNLMADTDGDLDVACRLAQVSRSRLYQLLKKHGVGRPGRKAGHPASH